MSNLTEEQQAAYDEALKHVAQLHPRKQHYSIHGLAGTGKSFVLAEIGKRLPNAIPCTATAKAASVLRNRGLNAKTVHSVIYDFLGNKEDEETGKVRPVFQPKGDPLKRTTILLDEDSMIGRRMANDILATGARLITTGDPGQLQPVMDERYFDRADATLRTPHRQAMESAVIRQAYNVRIHGEYQDDGDDFRVVSKTTAYDRMQADVALCWKNATRRCFNRVRRQDAALPAHAIKQGEPIMCLRNDHDQQIYNGVIYTVDREWQRGDELWVREELTNRLIRVLDPHVEDFSPQRDDMDEATPFALAYAVTCHKSQGSAWRSVLFIDEHPRNDAWGFLAYTAITRAEKSVLVVRR